MKKFLLVQFVLIFSFCLFPQSEPGDNSLSEIEEYGTCVLDSKFSSTETILDTTTWTQVSNAPNPTGRPGYGVIGNYLFVFGGQNQTSQAVAYNISNSTWVTSTPPTAPGYNLSSCIAHGELYKMSGTGSVNVFEKFTPNPDATGTWTVLASAPASLMNAQASIVYDDGNFIYASSANYATPAESFFARYNITTNTWESLTGSIFPKRYAGMAFLNNTIYLIGGLVPSGVDPTVCQKYDVATQTWSTFAPAMEALSFTKWSVSTDGRYIWLIGSGGGYSTYPASSNIYYYDPLADSWQLEGVLPAVRGLALGLYLPGFNKLFFGGGNVGGSGTAFTNECWEGTGGIYIPVELVSFKATASGKNITLEWTTASELNNAYFQIERSHDDIIYQTISTLNGNGSTTQPHSYDYKDVVEGADKVFYRLKQIDFNGSFSYSKIIEVNLQQAENSLPAKFELLQNYPNPFNPSTKIFYSVPSAKTHGSESARNVALKVYDALGNEVVTLVNEAKEPGTYEVKFDASSLNREISSGVYFYRLQSESFSQVNKMILTK